MNTWRVVIMDTAVKFVVLGMMAAGPLSSNSSGLDTKSRAGNLRSDNGLQLDLAWCPPGQFRMGSPPNETGRQGDEDQVDVILTYGFWLGLTEITQAQWKSVMGTEPWLQHGDPRVYRSGSDYPAVYVSHDEALFFCQTLTTQERRAGRLCASWEYTLPSEAQWEYGCRAGSQTRYSFGNDALLLPEYAWFETNAANLGEQYAHRVGQKSPNAWGLLDMPGNVYEWCRDAYRRKLPGGCDPLTTDGPDRVYRAGSWSYPAEYCRSANRGWNAPGNRYYYLGFRIVAVPCVTQGNTEKR